MHTNRRTFQTRSVVITLFLVCCGLAFGGAAWLGLLSSQSPPGHPVTAGVQPPQALPPSDGCIRDPSMCPKAAPPSPPVQTVDTVLKKLVTGVVAFNTPDNMRLAQTQSLEARLGVSVPREQLVREVTAEGEVKTAVLKVSQRMQATLLGGAAFDVTPSGPQVQFISNEETNIWQWQVTPKLEGKQVLMIIFDALIEVNGKEGLHTVNTLRHPINVEIGWPDSPREWAEWFRKWVEYGGWLWTALLLPICLLLLRKWRSLHPEPPPPASSGEANT